jgi:hypothetical protein
MSTFPLRSKVAEWIFWPLVTIFPVGMKVPVDGSYSSALGLSEEPPAIRTLPSSKSVAVWDDRGVAIAPVEVNVRSEGLYNSALGK